MVTIGYPPHYIGGTEIYVSGLVDNLKRRGHCCQVVYIEAFCQKNAKDIYVIHENYSGIMINIIRVNTYYHKLEFLIFDTELREKLIEKFQSIILKFQPDLIHMHPVQLGFDAYLIKSLAKQGHKVIFTYHTPTISCARGDLLFMGREVCDGKIIQQRCTQCMFHKKSIPTWISKFLSKISLSWYQFAYNKVSKFLIIKKFKSFVSIPILINERIKSWDQAISYVTKFIAVSKWVEQIIIKNNVAKKKVALIRHGFRSNLNQNVEEPTEIVKFGYLGRIATVKGIQILLEALRKIPKDINYEFEFYSHDFNKINKNSEEENLISSIYRLEKKDHRIRIISKNSVEILSIITVIAKWDALIIPSVWLESGPQVIYESFAVKTPIIGSNRGGIAELVQEGKTGFLFEPGNSDQLKDLLITCSRNPVKLRALRANITSVRTMDDVTEEMLNIYGII